MTSTGVTSGILLLMMMMTTNIDTILAENGAPGEGHYQENVPTADLPLAEPYPWELPRNTNEPPKGDNEGACRAATGEEEAKDEYGGKGEVTSIKGREDSAVCTREGYTQSNIQEDRQA
ncbi:unnamed protein product [Fusarium equiseti]|uniref:Uncharacterized protein n=1 Tax=Fusarium equiseti TaxID=61235 RepID=A0A8J2JC12_FUSEQ|nr:unnamed protein product [Fusarium equiseti]